MWTSRAAAMTAPSAKAAATRAMRSPRFFRGASFSADMRCSFRGSANVADRGVAADARNVAAMDHRIDEVRVAPAAVGLDDRRALRPGPNDVREVVQREGHRVMPAVEGLDRVLRDRPGRRVTVVAGG